MTKRGTPNLAGRTVTLEPGARQGRLTVLAEEQAILPDGATERVLRCRCECGTEFVPRLAEFLGHHIRSCGCLHKEAVAAQMRFRNTVLAGIPMAERKAWWARHRCSIIKEPERAAAMLEQAKQRERLARCLPSPEQAARLALRRRQQRAEARRESGQLTPGRQARWERTEALGDLNDSAKAGLGLQS
jgi:hypothetical protein